MTTPAMTRTRTAVLRGARECVLVEGTRKTTMIRIALVAGVAKATLYNHFRAKEEVFAALVDAEVAQVITEARELVRISGPQTALVRAAERLATHPVVRRLAQSEPGTLARIVIPGDDPGLSWAAAREALFEILGSDHNVELALRWLVSQLLWPSTREEIVATSGLLLGGSSSASTVVEQAESEPVLMDNHLGFPKVAERIPGVLTEIH